MTNEQRLQQTRDLLALAKAELDLIIVNDEDVIISPMIHVINALNYIRAANAAIQAMERSQAGVPEPKRG